MVPSSIMFTDDTATMEKSLSYELQIKMFKMRSHNCSLIVATVDIAYWLQGSLLKWNTSGAPLQN